MKFCEAMEKLKSGSKVTREPWKQGVYFLLDDNGVKSYQPKLDHYIYDEEIMVSTGWTVDGNEDEMNFCDVVPLIRQGAKAKLKDWKNSFIYFDHASKRLVLQTISVMPFLPEFHDFIAEDWIELT